MVGRCVVADQRVFGQVDQKVGDLMPHTTTSPTIEEKALGQNSSITRGLS